LGSSEDHRLKLSLFSLAPDFSPRGQGQGQEAQGWPQISTSRKEPLPTQLPNSEPSHPPHCPHPLQAKGVYNKPCGAPEKIPLSLRDLTTALPDIGDLFCLSLHILTSAFLCDAAVRPGLPSPLCVLLSLAGVLLKPPITDARPIHTHESGVLCWVASGAHVGCLCS
jgi:hypothetical protein